MAIEKALIARAHPHVLAARMRSLLDLEAAKGCVPDIYPFPVGLEPSYCSLREINSAGERDEHAPDMAESLSNPADLLRVRVWVSPALKFNWVRAELFIKSVKDLKHKIGYEIVGNQDRIEIYFVLHHDDFPQLSSAFKSQFTQCELTTESLNTVLLSSVRNWSEVAFLDYYPLPPYSHLFTQPEEFRVSPLNGIITALAAIEPPAVGIYQLLFQGVSAEHDWHQNINILNDFEYMIKLMTGMPLSQRTPLQPPSGELRGMALDTEKKAHNDKPLYAAAMRMGITGGVKQKDDLQKLGVFANLFQHGGRPLASVPDTEYRHILSSVQMEGIVSHADTYRPGFLLNSSELTGMVHLPPPAYLSDTRIPSILLESLPAKDDDLLSGTPIGICHYAGKDQIICIPPKIRSRSTHLLARQGMGKSTLLEHMVLADIAAGAGVAVLDPHGDLVFRLLHLIPENYVEKSIYFFVGDQKWIPLWNPLRTTANQDISRTSDDLVAAIKNIVQGWGDRLETLLRHAFYALLNIHGASLLDVSNLLRKKSNESRLLLEEIDRSLDNELARQFWRNDFPNYTNQDLSPPQHKLSKLLMSGTTSLMLSQPENRFPFREIMDSGKILLVDLSSIGFELRELLGSFILSLLHISAVSRSDIPWEERKPFHIYCDEAHLFLPSAIGELIPETRKFAVDLTLSHQYLRQFDNDARDAILTSGSTIVFNVDLTDARYLIKDFRDLVKPEDLASFEVGEAIARIGTEVVKIHTPGPLAFPKDNAMQRIIDRSHQEYYKPVAEVKESLAARYGHVCSHIFGKTEDISDVDGSRPDEFKYDEFD